MSKTISASAAKLELAKLVVLAPVGPASATWSEDKRSGPVEPSVATSSRLNVTDVPSVTTLETLVAVCATFSCGPGTLATAGAATTQV